MRIPISNIYRAFSELDSFSDEQCDRFMKRIKVSGARRALPGLVFFLVSGFGLIFSCIAFGFIFDAINTAFNKSGSEINETLIVGLCLFVTMVLPPVLGLIVRDVLLRRHLRLVIDDKLNRIKCLGCRYLLIGQVVHDHAVGCPECGRVNPLNDLGVVEADLIPPKQGASPRRATPPD